MKVIGIDYGSKMAGTTVIAFEEGGRIKTLQSSKKQDADRMILDVMGERAAAKIGIDAPLSLPGVYTGLAGFEDYFYRLCDRQLNAMSPMFLGGLTARAMKLKSELVSIGVELFEVYPVGRGKTLGLEAYGYRKSDCDYVGIRKILEDQYDWLILSDTPANSHELDAILAFIITKALDEESTRAGDSKEGVIYY